MRYSAVSYWTPTWTYPRDRLREPYPRRPRGPLLDIVSGLAVGGIFRLKDSGIRFPLTDPGTRFQTDDSGVLFPLTDPGIRYELDEPGTTFEAS